MTRIAVIGTAGRREDADRLDLEVYDLMLEAFRAEIEKLPRPWDLVSGGAAWADHVAVDLFLEGMVDSLTLYFPCAVYGSAGSVSFPDTDVGRTVTYYHKRFSEALGSSSFSDLSEAISRGARAMDADGFHARNLLVGQVDVVLAATFGRGKIPKDGGTAHTWQNSAAPVKIHISLHDLLNKEELAQGELF